MPDSSLSFALVGAVAAGLTFAAATNAEPSVSLDAEMTTFNPLPQHLTDEERAIVEESPLHLLRGSTPPPTGPVWCPPEYAPVDGVLFGWSAGLPISWRTIISQLSNHITNTGDADVHVFVTSSANQNDAFTRISNAGADMSRVFFHIRPLDSIWMRDYGPRYIYEGQVRGIVDHTYNRPRLNDNNIPGHFSDIMGHEYYLIPLVHGGGNYHVGEDRGRTTTLINDENPGLTQSQIYNYWLDYQNIDTAFYQPFPTFVDSTQHIDMWMQVFGENEVMISEWPNNPGSIQANICDSTAAAMAAEGYTVHRVPARSVSGTHYTYTNVVICNDLIIIPSYTNATVSPHNSQALAAWQAAAPDKTVVQVNGQAIVTASGVFHCIMMHMPAHLGGDNPTAYLRTPREFDTYNPGDNVLITWSTDDREGVQNVDLLLSLDGGATYGTTIATAIPDTGAFNWDVPDIYTARGRIQVVARNGDGLTGADTGDVDFTILGSCPGDLTGSGNVGSADLSVLLGDWGSEFSVADMDGNGSVGSSDLAALLGAWGPCP
ncbi:MAG: hypothetical protein EA376_06205 [Phycisphaeraceae bacterium]|nr:MAG: hypothetical protein EA376_06205 [Phycisphaeraceae bacterium]